MSSIELPNTSGTARDETTSTSHPSQHVERARLRLISAGVSFFCAGMNDGSLGALLPYVLRTYQIASNRVVVIYITTLIGWLFIAILNPYLSQKFGLGILLLMGAASQLVAQLLRTWLVSFSLYATTFFIQGLGVALQDTHSNSFIVTVRHAHRWLGFIHSMYALGSVVGPFVATTIAATEKGSKWYLYYTSLVGIDVFNLLLVVVAFRDSLKLKVKSLEQPSTSTSTRFSTFSTAAAELRAVLHQKAVWMMSLYFFFFLGAVITASGWVVEFLVQVRGGKLSEMGYVSVGLAGGTFLGRALLVEPTKHFGERRMVLIYVILCLGFELIFWLIPNIIVDAVAISLFGFFSGPFFATGIHVGSQLFPARLRSGSLAVIFMLGQIGGSIFPAITGIIASKGGVQVLQPILVSLCCATGVTWLLLPPATVRDD